jgi:HEAT repeat protein
MLEAHDSALRLRLLALLQKQKFVEIHHTPSRNLNHQAAEAFRRLGAEAKTAVPTLMGIYRERISFDSQTGTAEALGWLGPEAKQAVPLLLQTATDTNAARQGFESLRGSAIVALGRIRSEPNSVVPVLTKILNDPDRSLHVSALFALGEFGPDAKPAIPTIFELLKDRSTSYVAASAIRKIDPETAARRKVEIDAFTPPRPR